MSEFYYRARPGAPLIALDPKNVVVIEDEDGRPYEYIVLNPESLSQKVERQADEPEGHG